MYMKMNELYIIYISSLSHFPVSHALCVYAYIYPYTTLRVWGYWELGNVGIMALDERFRNSAICRATAQTRTLTRTPRKAPKKGRFWRPLGEIERAMPDTPPGGSGPPFMRIIHWAAEGLPDYKRVSAADRKIIKPCKGGISCK